MFSTNKVKTPLLFTVFFVLITFTIPVTIYAGHQKVDCPCFTMEDLMTFAPAGPYVIHTERHNFDGETEVDYWVNREQNLDMAGRLYEGCYSTGPDPCMLPTGEGLCCGVGTTYETPMPSFSFWTTISPDVGGGCLGYSSFTKDEASPYTTHYYLGEEIASNEVQIQLLTLDEAKACIQLLWEAQKNDAEIYQIGLKKPNQSEDAQ